jgi:hypothetical protein
MWAYSPEAYTSTADRVFDLVAVPLDPKITYDNIVQPVNYDERGHAVGIQYPPVAMGNKCLFYFSHVRNQTAWDYGIYMADWLALRADPDMGFAYDFPWKTYNLTAGWHSALGQAHISECFMKAYERTGDEKYLEMAKRTLLYIENVMIDEGNDRWWYEEYPSEGGSYVLNGHQFVLVALSKYLEIQEDPEIRQLFDNGLRALKVDAFLYDDGVNNSFYDRLGHPALKYHATHIINFQRLHDITGDRDWLVIKQVFEE